jgi:hypothetical protein
LAGNYGYGFDQRKAAQRWDLGIVFGSVSFSLPQGTAKFELIGSFDSEVCCSVDG